MSEIFYLKSPTYRVLTSKKALGFCNARFKPSVYNWASLMVLENKEIFRKENMSSLALLGSYLSLRPGRPQAVAGRVQNDLHPGGEGSRGTCGGHSVPRSL